VCISLERSPKNRKTKPEESLSKTKFGKGRQLNARRKATEFKKGATETRGEPYQLATTH